VTIFTYYVFALSYLVPSDANSAGETYVHFKAEIRYRVGIKIFYSGNLSRSVTLPEVYIAYPKINASEGKFN